MLSDASQKYVLGLLLTLLAGGGIGWFFGRLELGMLLAALAALGWQANCMLIFDRALREKDFNRFGDSRHLWALYLSRYRSLWNIATRRKKDYRALLREVRKSTNAMPDGAVVLDADNKIINCNSASKELAGLKRKKDRGRRVDNILRDPELTRLLQLDDPKATVDIRSPIRDDFWLNCRAVPYGGEQKLLLLRDITERARLSKMRRDFVANASHELRSPLTVISGYLDGLADDEAMPADWKKPVKRMRRQAARMRQLLSELLQLSRLESSGSASSEQPVDVVGISQALREAVSEKAKTAEINIVAESAAQILGNRSDIETVISNLLSNAIRYTPADGDITITWRAGENGGELRVKDTGEGIAAEAIPRLTERFFRGDKGRSRDDGGIGLGLAIVKHALARHDAELVVTSKVGVGSEFCCHFPPDRIAIEKEVAVS